MKIKNLKTTSKVLGYLDDLGKLIEGDKNYSELYFSNQLLRYYNTLMIVEEKLKPGSALDIGSYPSHLHKIFLMMGYDAYGIDIDPGRISLNLKDCRLRTYAADIEAPGWNTGGRKYDIVFLLEVIEHLHVNPLIVFLEMNNLLKKGGYLFLSTPNLFSLRNRINFVRGRYVGEHPLSVYEKLDRHGSRGHQRIYSVEELEDILDVYGFDTINKWCLNDSSPAIDKKEIKNFLTDNFSFERFARFWSQSVSWKGKIKLKIEEKLNLYFSGYYNSIYIIARKNRQYDKSKVFEKIKKTDRWVSCEKFQL